MFRFRPTVPALPAVAAALAAQLLPCAAVAEELSPAGAELPPLVVSATRLPTPAAAVASSVTVISGAAIERHQERGIADALRGVPGLDLVQNGGPGGAASALLRGANANHTKVLIDGIPANDPSDVNGSFDFGPFLATDIERIEVLRGPQSGLYGSDAIGGVINIVTKEGKGPLKLRAAAEGGSFATFNQFGSASGSVDRFSYAFNAGHLRSGATPVTPLALLPPGRARIDDSYENTTLSTKLGAELTETFGIGLVARYALTSLRFTGDDFSRFPSIPDAAQSATDKRQFLTRGEGRLRLFDGVLEQRFGVAYIDDRSRSVGPDDTAPPSFARGDRVGVDWLGTLHLGEEATLLAGIEQDRDEIRESPISASNTNRGGFLELQSAAFDRLFASATVRIDDNERFGSVATWRLAPAFLVPETGTKLKGSLGTGFKAPSLTQLFVDFPAFNFFANPGLRPEESFGWDAGFEQSLQERAVTLGATWFHNDIDNLITENASFTSLENLAQATTYGLEAFVAYAPIEELKLRADYTYTLARDVRTGGQLLRRPRHKASLDAAWRVSEAATLSTRALYVGPRIDGNRDFSVPRLTANGYTTIDLSGSYELTRELTAFARVENLLDRRYEDPTGFLRPGLGVFVGLRVALASNREGKSQ